MVNMRFVLIGWVLSLLAAMSSVQAVALDLKGYADAEGAISVQYQGDTVDPYFALQALLLAHDHGLDITVPAKAWANWLVQRQKPDATFDRFCRRGPVWAPCKTADADDALHALWLRLNDTPPLVRPTNPALIKSYALSQAALARLLDPQRGVYLVSPVFQHGLFMDNLEVLSWYQHAAARPAGHPGHTPQQLAGNIQRAFWDGRSGNFLVSTQPEHSLVKPAFYPELVAQIFPLLFDFRQPGIDLKKHYSDWMRQHRATWLAQVKDDFAWGLIALIALHARDPASAACWLRETASARHSPHWTVTDEVVLQILQNRKLQPAAAVADCQ